MESTEDQRRLDGSLYDGVLLEALQVEGGAPDLQNVATEAVALSSSLTSYALIIPSVDARTGGPPPGLAWSPWYQTHCSYVLWRLSSPPRQST